jgi:hypothetical protein
VAETVAGPTHVVEPRSCVVLIAPVPPPAAFELVRE